VRSSVNTPPSGPALKYIFSTFLRGGIDPKKKFAPKKLKVWFFSNPRKNPEKSKKNLGHFL